MQPTIQYGLKQVNIAVGRFSDKAVKMTINIHKNYVILIVPSRFLCYFLLLFYTQGQTPAIQRPPAYISDIQVSPMGSIKPHTKRVRHNNINIIHGPTYDNNNAVIIMVTILIIIKTILVDF